MYTSLHTFIYIYIHIYIYINTYSHIYVYIITYIYIIINYILVGTLPVIPGLEKKERHLSRSTN